MADIHALVLGDPCEAQPFVACLRQAGVVVIEHDLNTPPVPWPSRVDVVVVVRRPVANWLVPQASKGGAAVVVVASSEDSSERGHLLDDGVDHVLHGDVTEPEVVAQVMACARRLEPPHVRSVVMDDGRRHAIVSGRQVPLTASEARLLTRLVESPGRTFSHAELMKAVSGSTIGAASLVSAYIRRLRQKIEPDPSSPTFILTTWGAGYRFEDTGRSYESPAIGQIPTAREVRGVGDPPEV